jgi:hypothetical protein
VHHASALPLCLGGPTAHACSLPARRHTAAAPVRALLLLSARATTIAPAGLTPPAAAVRMRLRMHVGLLRPLRFSHAHGDHLHMRSLPVPGYTTLAT